MLDPQGIVTVDEAAVAATLGPILTAEGPASEAGGPVLLHALRGFVDAGSTGEIATAHLVQSLATTRLATFDVDQLLDYRSKRSLMTFETDRWTAYDEPFLALDHVRDADGAGFLLLHGSEPDLQWERVIAAVRGLVERFRVSLTIGFHGIPMGVPHTRPITLTAHGTRAGLTEDYTSFFGSVQVPSSISALLEYRLGEAGHDALGFVVHVPHYLAQSQYTPAAVVALQHVERATGLDLLTGRLAAAAADATIEVEKQVAESGEVLAVVRALEEQYDRFASRLGRPSLLAQEAPIPTADELGAEFERYLAQQDDD
ncbi:proteasome assembly chaperone family protein [Xylanimonas protaetiae]|uniref:PAC2 family protein n=1 Tax=Xylanimonas protaetiae TaxID=2509457 RepID=A0A4P6F8H5_9MICO|nr:PAC2 family protein [Xylanimonas protaetiae]QAY70619.1 PAC2 family protein [Xylanimonas protaetiae]